MTDASDLIEATLAEGLLVFAMLGECPCSIDVESEIADWRQGFKLPFIHEVVVACIQQVDNAVESIVAKTSETLEFRHFL